MGEIKKEKIQYESIIAGLLLKFESIDNIDFSLLIEDFKNKAKVGVCGLWYRVDNIDKYVKFETNGIISLKDGITLDYFIKKENQTLREKLLKIAGNKVNDYMNGLDVEKYRAEKEKTLKDNKEKVLNEANILLISDIQDDYDELIKYGFKNVDYFKSIIRADSYFAKYPKELEKYHIILKGHQNVQHCCFEGDVELDRTIYKLRDEKQILVTSLSRYDYSDCIELVAYLSDCNNYRFWDTKETTYSAIFDRIVENVLINHTLEKVDLKDTKFVPIQDKINANRLSLPTKKSHLKILYLDTIEVNELATRISEELQLNITFKKDNNFSLGRYVKTHLGDYDIIIVSHSYSGSLLGMNSESTEQCKDTGRELTLLISYDFGYFGVDSELGDAIKLNYKFGGNIAPSLKFHSKEFRVLRQQIESEEKDEYWTEQRQRKYSQTRAILEASVSFYNEALLQMEKSAISDLDFRTADELDNEYALVIEEERKRKEAELAPIRLFDKIRYSVSRYLDYRKKGLINQIPEGLKIIEGNDGIRVENLYQGRTLCAVVFSKNYKKEDLRIFEVQTLSKKGTLSSPQTIGVYTSKYENLENIPNRPDEKQENALISIEKKISVALRPLNEEAWKRQLERNRQESKALSLKRNNQRRK